MPTNDEAEAHRNGFAAAPINGEAGAPGSTEREMGTECPPFPMPAGAKVSIFWDIENCCMPAGVDPALLSQRVQSALQQHGQTAGCTVAGFSAYGDMRLLPQHVRAWLQRTGVNLIDVPHSSKNAADIAILSDLFLFALDAAPPAAILLISGDVDFAASMHKLKLRGYTILLAKPLNHVSRSLTSAAAAVWDWASLARGAGISACVPSDVVPEPWASAATATPTTPGRKQELKARRQERKRRKAEEAAARSKKGKGKAKKAKGVVAPLTEECKRQKAEAAAAKKERKWKKAEETAARKDLKRKKAEEKACTPPKAWPSREAAESAERVEGAAAAACKRQKLASETGVGLPCAQSPLAMFPVTPSRPSAQRAHCIKATCGTPNFRTPPPRASPASWAVNARGGCKGASDAGTSAKGKSGEKGNRSSPWASGAKKASEEAEGAQASTAPVQCLRRSARLSAKGPAA